VIGDLGVQQLDAASDAAQAGCGCDGLDIPGALQPEPPAGADRARRCETTQPLTEGVGGDDDQGMQLALGVGSGLDRRAPCCQPDRERGPIAGGTRLSEPVTAQGLTSRPSRIDRVGLGAVAAGGPLGPIQLDHLLVLSAQESGQAAP
jgi:hypothetical protein